MVASLAAIDNPENQEIVLRARTADVRIETFTHYEYHSHFLTPSDGWSFTIGDAQRLDELRGVLMQGALVDLSIDNHLQATGFIDSVDIQNGREGTIMTVRGRDRFGPVVDACADPTMRFAETQTLEQILDRIFSTFGLNVFTDSNDANRGVITGSKRGIRTTKRGKPLKKAINHQVKPYPREGAFNFASRLAQRLGLWIWLSADGTEVIVGTPDFDQDARYTLLRKRDNAGTANNIISGGAKKDITDQPDLIIAEGFSGGAEWGHSRIKALGINPLTAVDADGLTIQSVQDIINRHPEAAVVTLDLPSQARILVREKLGDTAPPPRLLYLHDDESHKPEQLQNFVRRELAHRTKQALQVSYTVEGHTQRGVPWAVDTIVDVQDDIADVHENLWVISRTFEKSRTNGTVTHLELIRKHTMVF